MKIGNVTLELSNVLYSPKLSCDILSVVCLKEDLGNIAAKQNDILLDTSATGSNKPIAKLVSFEGVLFVQEILEGETKRLPVAAPGVARIPNGSSAQRWHERFGHTG